jgi:prepilin-type N-terminal cleavage/methylation domain-containing protein
MMVLSGPALSWRMRAASGFSLIEVLIALVVVSVGLAGFAGTLGPVSMLAGRGKQDSRAALIVESRLHRFRAMLSGSTGCLLPPNGSEQHASGIREAWSSVQADSIVTLTVLLILPGTSPRSDTVVTRMPCP